MNNELCQKDIDFLNNLYNDGWMPRGDLQGCIEAYIMITRGVLDWKLDDKMLDYYDNILS